MQIFILFAFCQLPLVARGVCVTSLAARHCLSVLPFHGFFARLMRAPPPLPPLIMLLLPRFNGA